MTPRNIPPLLSHFSSSKEWPLIFPRSISPPPNGASSGPSNGPQREPKDSPKQLPAESFRDRTLNPDEDLLRDFERVRAREDATELIVTASSEEGTIHPDGTRFVLPSRPRT
jgi:hypothetical protein